MKTIIVILLTFACPIFSRYVDNSDSCALRACHQLSTDKINVHLIPHSHDDVGWLKTVDDYYYGVRNDIHNVGVQYVLDSVMQALQQDSSRRYIQVETAFFWKWWQYQSESKKQQFRDFVESGRIEMVGGGWSMNDEACVNYQSTINQFTWGLRILNDTLGECGRPRIGWQIDPFGHSREQASIFKQMGYNAIFFTRLSESDRQARKNSSDLEFTWRTNDNFEDSDIFTSIMDGYYAPKDFCWDYLQCTSDAINDDPESFDYNLEQKVSEFADRIEVYASYFKTNNILFTMGGDFQYQAAELNYLNIDKLIKGFLNHPKYNVFYSTPSCYVQAVKSHNVPFNVKKTGDFFPYAENDHAYWSGYYTSRSTLKRFERTGNNILQAASQLNAFAKMMNIISGTEAEENLRDLREAVGTMQHHDAITGTEKERVAKDYARILTDAIRKTEANIGNTVGNIIKLDGVTDDIKLELSTCLLTNISVCDNTVTKNRSLIVVYNPLPAYVYYHLRLPVVDGNYSLTGVYGAVNFELVKHMKYHVESPYQSSDTELVTTDQIPPLGMKLYYLEKHDDTPTAIEPILVTDKEEIVIQKGKAKITLDPKTGIHKLFLNKKEEYVEQQFMYYDSNNGTGDSPTSGAYIFRPENGTSATDVQEDSYKVMYLKGEYTEEIIETFGDYVVQTLRLMIEDQNVLDLEYVEYDWVIGPLNNKTVDTVNNIGKEVIVRYSTGQINNNLTFYTDSNGRQMIERQSNNYSYDDTTKEAVTSNYYPVTSRITYKDKDKDFQLSVLTDRSQGGASLANGQLELMLHRRTLKDDYKGVEEPLQEMEFDDYILTRGQHYLIPNSYGASKTERILALRKLSQPWVLTADATSDDMSLEALQAKLNFKWIGLTTNGGNGLPPNVNILTFEPWKDDTYLLRFEHIFEKNEDDEYSKDASVVLKYIFSPYVISSIQELSLGANEFIDGTIEGYNYNITLAPMEIRTFLVTFVKQE